VKEKANYPKKKNKKKIELFLAFLAEGKNGTNFLKAPVYIPV